MLYAFSKNGGIYPIETPEHYILYAKKYLKLDPSETNLKLQID